jgi:hypothetical protein
MIVGGPVGVGARRRNRPELSTRPTVRALDINDSEAGRPGYSQLAVIG